LGSLHWLVRRTQRKWDKSIEWITGGHCEIFLWIFILNSPFLPTKCLWDLQTHNPTYLKTQVFMLLLCGFLLWRNEKWISHYLNGFSRNMAKLVKKLNFCIHMIQRFITGNAWMDVVADSFPLRNIHRRVIARKTSGPGPKPLCTNEETKVFSVN
jgi:hypothetical protein